jgi:ketosteroid isomerase-like protein
MSEANVERFVEGIEAFNRLSEDPAQLGSEDLRSFLEMMDPKVRFEPQQAAIEGGYSGREGVAAWLADLADVYGGGSLRFAEIRDLGDRVLALGTLRFSGTGSGIETEAPIAIVAAFRDGRITRLTDYGDKARALEAMELPE